MREPSCCGRSSSSCQVFFLEILVADFKAAVGCVCESSCCGIGRLMFLESFGSFLQKLQLSRNFLLPFHMWFWMCFYSVYFYSHSVYTVHQCLLSAGHWVGTVYQCLWVSVCWSVPMLIFCISGIHQAMLEGRPVDLKTKTLQDLFRPPLDLLFKGSFEEVGITLLK